MVKNEDRIYVYAIIVSFILHVILINILPGLKQSNIEPEEERVQSVKTRFVKLNESTPSEAQVKQDIQKSKVETEETGDNLEKQDLQKESGDTEEIEFRDNMPEVELAEEEIIKREDTRNIILSKEDEINFKIGKKEVEFKKEELKFNETKGEIEENLETLEEKIPVKLQEDLDEGDVEFKVGDIESEGAISEVEMPAGIKRLEVEGKGKIASFRGKKPQYPEIAKKRGWEGRVQLDFIVDENSNVIKVEVIKKSGYDILDIAAKKEIQNWQVKIVEKGMQIKGKVSVIINFKLESGI